MKTISHLFIALSVVCTNVVAEVKDYQVIRLIAMKSECQREDLNRFNRDKKSVTFQAKCSNVSHYPDGVKVHCSDRGDERSCKIMTAAKEFNHLKLLQSN
ncbi:hypothetical protein [Neptuniibacter caesariensis]|uniref:Uncharacterized protein n=1 Tax=Neptuniibacter caesariensis TaxID=207954 RepID=A0A7U8C8L4_NEPCE|nr:hypothetical protein [Neptuniibacter caesariensis]EAR62090.1 hypothetical protein MED92_10304 [Oceanospirillum sp. MED92] [Neptuniibacter caesariensis]